VSKSASGRAAGGCCPDGLCLRQCRAALHAKPRGSARWQSGALRLKGEMVGAFHTTDSNKNPGDGNNLFQPEYRQRKQHYGTSFLLLLPGAWETP